MSVHVYVVLVYGVDARVQVSRKVRAAEAAMRCRHRHTGCVAAGRHAGGLELRQGGRGRDVAMVVVRC